MPLGFRSLNRDVIAFGFFNIDTDLLLLERYFLFASDFCRQVSSLAEQEGGEVSETSWEGYEIADPRDIGDLMGAIHGTRNVGFIGDVYRRFPFPESEDAFKQQPEGLENRSLVEPMIERYGKKTAIALRLKKTSETVAVAEYLFTKGVFQKLIEYVWLGGYPRWRDGVRPPYVMEMKDRIEKSRHWLFAGLLFPS
ncbi:MAG: hypothetical protein MUO52_14290 [Desulfobacterales bacterium]|nr:hypothetical protein [Desulfobacterales bacterium]